MAHPFPVTVFTLHRVRATPPMITDWGRRTVSGEACGPPTTITSTQLHPTES